jgi:hypothetical protein
MAFTTALKGGALAKIKGRQRTRCGEANSSDGAPKTFHGQAGPPQACGCQEASSRHVSHQRSALSPPTCPRELPRVE